MSTPAVEERQRLRVPVVAGALICDDWDGHANRPFRNNWMAAESALSVQADEASGTIVSE